MVEPLSNIPCHFQVLNLIPADRHIVGIEHQNISRHQYWVTEQTHGYRVIRIFAFFQIFLHSSLVGMGPIHQTLGGNAGKKPCQFKNFRNIGLAIKKGLVGIQPQGQPCGGNLESGPVHNFRVPTLDQRMIVRQEIT